MPVAIAATELIYARRAAPVLLRNKLGKGPGPLRRRRRGEGPSFAPGKARHEGRLAGQIV